MAEIYDIVGIGFGPANIALAVALEEAEFDGSVLFLERQRTVTWQPHMLLDRSDVQHHPLRDLVTPRNPRSYYTFTNFLHKQQRLFDYLNLGIHFPLRKEYAQYVNWVGSHFDRWVKFGTEVQDIEVVERPDGIGSLFELRARNGTTYFARSLVLAPGRTPYIPDIFEPHLGDLIFHLSRYKEQMDKLSRIRQVETIAIVGASQSAIEIVLDISKRYPETKIINIIRGFGYKLKDTSHFSEHVYFPDFIDYYYHCSAESKRQLNCSLRSTNYSSADADAIHELYLTLYEQRLDGRQQIELRPNRNIREVGLNNGKVHIGLEEIHQNYQEHLDTDAVVLATGFRNLGINDHEEKYPPVLAPLISALRVDSKGILHINRDYSLEWNGDHANSPALYLNGLCESSHGLGDAGSFSLLSLRSWEIASSILDRLAKNGLSAEVPANMAIVTA